MSEIYLPTSFYVDIVENVRHDQYVAVDIL